MREGASRGLALAAVLFGIAAAGPGSGQEREEPWNDAGELPLEYRGPGREVPEPDVDEVLLGWFGPSDPDHPRGGDFWRGALLALERENAERGYGGRPFRLVARWSDSAWTAGGVEVSRLAYEDGVWAVVGGIDGATAHLAEQIAFKARLALLSPGSTDVTANLAPQPWFFSCLPSDLLIVPRLVDAMAATAAPAKEGAALAIASAAEHDAHATLDVLRDELAARRIEATLVLEFDPLASDVTPTAERLLASGAQTLIVLAPPDPAARLVRAIRARGFEGPILGGATLAQRAFQRAAGDAAEGVVVPLLVAHTPEWRTFARDFVERWGEPPDHAAAQAYDAVRLLADAVRKAGLNRARIRDALRDLSAWTGVAGVVDWDALGRNRRPAGLATWRDGRLDPTPAATRWDDLPQSICLRCSRYRPIVLSHLRLMAPVPRLAPHLYTVTTIAEF